MRFECVPARIQKRADLTSTGLRRLAVQYLTLVGRVLRDTYPRCAFEAHELHIGGKVRKDVLANPTRCLRNLNIILVDD